MSTHQALPKLLAASRMYFDHHKFDAGWILLTLPDQDWPFSCETKMIKGNQSRRDFEFTNTPLVRDSISNTELRLISSFNAELQKIPTIFLPKSRSCFPVSQTPAKLGLQSRTWLRFLGNSKSGEPESAADLSDGLNAADWLALWMVVGTTHDRDVRSFAS